MAKAMKCTVLKNGKLLMAHPRKARVFQSKGNAVNFVKNLIRVSNKLTMKNFEFVPLN